LRNPSPDVKSQEVVGREGTVGTLRNPSPEVEREGTIDIKEEE